MQPVVPVAKPTAAALQVQLDFDLDAGSDTPPYTPRASPTAQPSTASTVGPPVDTAFTSVITSEFHKLEFWVRFLGKTLLYSTWSFGWCIISFLVSGFQATDAHDVNFALGGFFALYRSGVFCLHSLFLGSFAAVLVIGTRSSYSVSTSFALAFFISAARVFAVMAGKWLLAFFAQPDDSVMKTPKAATAFILLINPTMAVLVSGVSVATYLASGVFPSSDGGVIFLNSSTAAAAGSLMGAALHWSWLPVWVDVLAVSASERSTVIKNRLTKWKGNFQNSLKVFELIAYPLLSFGATLGIFVFSKPTFNSLDGTDYNFILYLSAVWGSTKFRGKFSTTVLFLCECVLLISQSNYRGPFSFGVDDKKHHLAHAFIIGLSSTDILLSSYFSLLSKVTKELRVKEKDLVDRNAELVLEADLRRQAIETIRLTQQRNEITLKTNRRIERSCQMLLALTTTIQPKMHPVEVMELVLKELATRFNPYSCSYIIITPDMSAQTVTVTPTNEIISKSISLKKANYEFRSMLKNYQQAVTISNIWKSALTQHIEKELESLGLVSFVAVPTRMRKNIALLTLQSISPRRWGGDFDLTLRLLADFLAGAIQQSTSWLKKTEAQKISHEAKEKAESATKAKSEFLARISHEIRTPISGVVGMVELLQSTTLTPDQSDLLKSITWSSEHLLAVINDVLDLSKIEANKLELEQIPTNVFEVVEQALVLVANKENKSAVELTYDIDLAIGPSVLSDPTRLRQIIVNLVGNAIKFTEQGYITVTARIIKSIECEETCPCHLPGNVLIRFAITDTGSGIPLESQSHLLESFAQADKTVTRKHGGTGLGLSISAQLAQAMGRCHSPNTPKGRRSLWFDSQIGKGSTFYFCIIAQMSPTDITTFSPLPLHPSLPDPLTALVSGSEVHTANCVANFLRRLGVEPTIVLASETWGRIADSRQPAFIVSTSANPFLIFDGPTLGGIPGIVAVPQELVLRCSRIKQGGETEAGREGINPHSLRPDIRLLSKPLMLSKLRDEILNLFLGGAERRSQSPRPIIEFSSVLNVGGMDVEKFRLEKSLEKTRRVLLAEDNLVNQKIIKRQLENIGCEVSIAMNGLEVLKLMEPPGGEFDVIFMDCHMPEMDGLEATAAIRKTNRKIPIVGLSAGALGEDREAAIAAGMDDYLTKPTKENILTEKISRYCR